MPTVTEWKGPELFMEYGGIEVFHTYHDDDVDQGENTYWFTTDDTSDEGPRFDVRDIGAAMKESPFNRTPKMFVNDPACADPAVKERVEAEWAAWREEDGGQHVAIRECITTAIDEGWLTAKGLTLPVKPGRRKALVIYRCDNNVDYMYVYFDSSDDDEEAAIAQFVKERHTQKVEEGFEEGEFDDDELRMEVEIVFTQKRLADNDLAFNVPPALLMNHSADNVLAKVTTVHDSKTVRTPKVIPSDGKFPVWIVGTQIAVEASSPEAALERAYELSGEVDWPLRVWVQSDDDADDTLHLFDLHVDGDYDRMATDENGEAYVEKSAAEYHAENTESNDEQ